MSYKPYIWATVIWLLLMLVGSGVGLWYLIGPIPEARTEFRAEKLGQGIGFMTVIGLAVIWLPRAFKVGQERRKLRQQSSQHT